MAYTVDEVHTQRRQEVDRLVSIMDRKLVRHAKMDENPVTIKMSDIIWPPIQQVIKEDYTRLNGKGNGNGENKAGSGWANVEFVVDVVNVETTVRFHRSK